MAFFIGPDGGQVDMDRDNVSRSVTRNATGKIATETIVTPHGHTYRKTYLFDANGEYSGETQWVPV